MAASSRTRAGAARRAPMESASEDWREKTMANLQLHAAISEKDIDISKSALVASSFLKEHGVGPSGMVFGFGAKYHRPNGSEYTFQDVPLQAIVECVRNNLLGRRTGVSDGVEPSRRKEIFDKIMTDLPSSYKAKVVWEDEPPPLDPNSKPTTPFSAPKPDRLGPAKSNGTLIDDLARAAGMKPDQAKGVAGQITWFDGSAGGKACCFITGDMRTISGGRLGRNHTLEDVPTCYVRDRVMDYINDQLPEEKRADVRRAVFSDLTEAEINLYSALIAEERIEAEAETPPPKRRGTSRPQLDRQQEVLCTIDDEIDLEPRFLRVIPRDIFSSIKSSVVKTRGADPLPVERLVEVDDHIFHDCDQVRAMVRRFITTGEWTMDEFRLTLGGVTRAQLNTFLEHRGPRNGLRCKAFQLCWEFFHRREKLSLPLTGAGSVRDEHLLERRAAKQRAAQRRAAKRSRAGGDAEDCRGGKRRKSDSTEEGA